MIKTKTKGIGGLGYGGFPRTDTTLFLTRTHIFCKNIYIMVEKENSSWAATATADICFSIARFPEIIRNQAWQLCWVSKKKTLFTLYKRLCASHNCIKYQQR